MHEASRPPPTTVVVPSPLLLLLPSASTSASNVAASAITTTGPQQFPLPPPPPKSLSVTTNVGFAPACCRFGQIGDRLCDFSPPHRTIIEQATSIGHQASGD